MKKVISLLLSLCIMLTAIPVFAVSESIARELFAEQITEIAQKQGGTVARYGDSIVVAKNGKTCLITKDTAIYMDNGVLVTENLYVDDNFIMLPKKALESVLGVDNLKSEAYKDRTEKHKEALAYYSLGARRIEKVTETDYGTIIEWSHIEPFSHYGPINAVNLIGYVRWDGLSVDVSNYAPYMDDVNKMAYELLTISSDGKTASITYPEIKNAGTFVVTVDLVNGTVTRDIIPFEKTITEETVKEPTEDTTDITASGKCEGYFWVDEESRPEATVLWEYANGTLTISGTGDMHDFYYTYGGRIQTTVTIGKPWKEFNDKIEKIVIEEGVESISRYAFVECKNLRGVIIADNVSIKREAFKNLKNLENITLGKNCTLERNAFITCTSLQSITIPEGTNVGEGAFNHCYSLSDVVYDGENISVDESAFDDCPMLTIN